jgi:hypothetical protein
MKKLLAIILTMSFALNASAYSELHIFNNSYDKLLKKFVKTSHVKDGVILNVVDYKKLKTSKELFKTSSLIKLVEVEGLTEQEKLSFWINAYNFYTLELVAKNIDEIESIKDLGSLFSSVWDKYKFEIDGNHYTLNNIEHNILRTKFDEPRVHFALVCASISCPDLRNEAYTAFKVYDQLEDQTKKFLNNNTKGIIIDKGMVKVSKIFRWYGKDFKPNKTEFIQKYNPIEYTHGYLDYNWNLNSL